MTERRKGLPRLPPRIAALPVDPRGYPIPWFVADPGDFRVASAEKRVRAVAHRLCWACGQPLGTHLVFVAGPMCGINRTSAEPPLHRDCAEWSVQACPFLLLPRSKRREANLPTEDIQGAPGIALLRNPGVIMLWTTHYYNVFNDGSGGWLIRLGDPLQVHWWCEGRTATREEVLASIESGLPSLEAMAKQDGPRAMAELERLTAGFMQFVPPSPPVGVSHVSDASPERQRRFDVET